jgi:tryptophan synthase alpha chain
VAAFADAAIVGAALVKALDAGGPAGVRALTEELSEGVRREPRAIVER